jgi:hypothetical protein
MARIRFQAEAKDIEHLELCDEQMAKKSTGEDIYSEFCI